jgi:hypothetical protein
VVRRAGLEAIEKMKNLLTQPGIEAQSYGHPESSVVALT